MYTFTENKCIKEEDSKPAKYMYCKLSGQKYKYTVFYKNKVIIELSVLLVDKFAHYRAS